MPTKVYLCGARAAIRVARTWLYREGFDPVPAPAETPVWADTVRRTIGGADVVVAFSGSRTGDRATEFELGVAAGLGKRGYLVGPPDHLGRGFGGFLRFARWEEARSALAKLGPSAPEVTLAPSDANYVLKFWNDYAVKIVNMPQYLDPLAPGLAAKVAEHARARGGIYRAACDAWRAAGAPGLVGPSAPDEPLSPEAVAYVEHAAVTEWFSRCVRLAEIDHTRDTLARERATVLASVPGSVGTPTDVS